MSRARSGQVVEELRERIAHLEGSTRRRAVILPFGVPEIDSALPGGGLASGRYTSLRAAARIPSMVLRPP